MEHNISLMNETKWYKIQPRPKVQVQKIFQTLPPKFAKGLNESWLEFHPFCMDVCWQNEANG